MFPRTLIQSFKFAISGLIYAVKTQRNMRIHLYLAFGVILIGLLFGLSKLEIALLCCVISFVLIAEIVNTALEVNLDFLNEKKFHPTIKVIKDVVAGVVLVASINALIVGCIIFLPYLNSFKYNAPGATEFKRPQQIEKEIEKELVAENSVLC